MVNRAAASSEKTRGCLRRLVPPQHGYRKKLGSTARSRKRTSLHLSRRAQLKSSLPGASRGRHSAAARHASFYMRQCRLRESASPSSSYAMILSRRRTSIIALSSGKIFAPIRRRDTNWRVANSSRPRLRIRAPKCDDIQAGQDAGGQSRGLTTESEPLHCWRSCAWRTHPV